MEGAIGNPTPQKVAVVTGANKGIGLEICRQLSARGVTVVLTARDEERGLAAVRKLGASGAADVVFHQLDVNDSASVASLGDFILTRFGKLDVLVNNAAIGGIASNTQVLNSSEQVMQPVSSSGLANAIVETYELAEECINTNYYGPKRVTEAFIPLLQSSQSPRIVNVSSLYGKLQYIRSERIKEELRNVDTLSEDRLDQMLQAFLNDFKEGKLDQNIWPTRNMMAYKVAKVALSAYTRILAKRYCKFNLRHSFRCQNWVHSFPSVSLSLCVVPRFLALPIFRLLLRLDRALEPHPMAATVLESLVVPSSPPTAAPRAAAALFPLAGRGSGLIPRFRGLRCASLPLRDAASRSRMVARRAATEVVCEAQETAVQLTDISKDTWQTLVLGSDVPVLIDFWAPWCGPCRMIEPTVAKLAKVYEGKLKCYKLNTDENPEIANQYGIRSIPTVMIFKSGEKKDTVIGAVPESTLATSIEKLI